MNKKQEIDSAKVGKGPIKKGLQFRYFRMIFSTVFFTVAILIAGVYAAVNLVLSTSQLGPYAEVLTKDIAFWINWLIAVVGLAAMFIAGGISLKISKNIAEPIYKLQDMISEEIIFHESRDADETVRNLKKILEQ